FYASPTSTNRAAAGRATSGTRFRAARHRSPGRASAIDSRVSGTTNQRGVAPYRADRRYAEDPRLGDGLPDGGGSLERLSSRSPDCSISTGDLRASQL